MKSPQTFQQTLQRYFLDNRARLIDIAAFLDRLDRAAGAERANCSDRTDHVQDSGANSAQAADFRLVAFRKALAELMSDETGRVDRVQLMLSDPTLEPLDSAAKSQGAFGASPHSCC